MPSHELHRALDLTSGRRSSVPNLWHRYDSDYCTTASIIEGNDVYPTSSTILGDTGHRTADIPIELPSCEGSIAMDGLPPPSKSTLEGGLEQSFFFFFLSS